STTSRKVVGKIPYPNATNGLEQSVWDPANGMFYQAVPATKANPGGEVDKIDPKTMKVVAIYAVTDCQPEGMVLGPSEHLLLGCSGDAIAAGARAQTIIMDAVDGYILAKLTQIGGSDQGAHKPCAKTSHITARQSTSTDPDVR